VGGGHAIDAFPHEGIVGIADPLAGLDEEINDFREQAPLNNKLRRG
jgi:hypothetical protein